MRQPSIPANLWLRLEHRLLRLVALSLAVLQEQQTSMPEDEVSINRLLRLCMSEANHILHQTGEGLSHLPMLDCKSQPNLSRGVALADEGKVPDFQWDIYDDNAGVGQRSRQYHIECKRLGLPPSRSWILNKEYVRSGICRFAEESHRYGDLCSSGAMIGYIQSMDAVSILQEVNNACQEKRISQLDSPIEGWATEGVDRMDHRFTRGFPVSPFDLRHYWVDLRRHYRGH